MRKLHSSLDGMEIHNLANVLESSGIACEVRGEYRRAVIGTVPIYEGLIELWIQDDSQEELARQVLSSAHPPGGEAWGCPRCGESIDAEFDRCWSCQTDRPA
jgi:hypothetical protein